MAFSEEVLNQLKQPIDPNRIKTFNAGGKKGTLSYVNIHDIVSRANELFGYSNWHYQIKRSPTLVGQFTTNRGAKMVLYMAEVEVDIDSPLIRRNEVGTCDGPDTIDGHTMAINGAVSNALKRAFRTFGPQFGLSLYMDDDPPPMYYTQEDTSGIPQPQQQPQPEQLPPQPQQNVDPNTGEINPPMSDYDAEILQRMEDTKTVIKDMAYNMNISPDQLNETCMNLYQNTLENMNLQQLLDAQNRLDARYTSEKNQQQQQGAPS